MSCFWGHKWAETERLKAPPAAGSHKFTRCSEHMYERLVFGVTVIVLTCASCGDKKTIEVLGHG